MKGLKVLGIALLLLLGMSVMAADTSSKASAADVGKSWTVNLNKPTHVGAALLPAGDYKVQHLKDGDSHVLVFRTAKKEIARVNCTMAPLSAKAADTLVTTDKNSAGERVLTRIAFRGDTFEHDVVP